MANKAISDFTEATKNEIGDLLLMQRGNEYYKVDIKNLGGGLLRAFVTLSQANLQAINSTPITILAAQGAGTYIEPVDVTAFMDYNGTAYATLTTLRIKHSGQSNLMFSTSVSFGTTAADRRERMVEGTGATNQQIYENTALVVDGNANATNNGGTCYLDVILRISRFSA